MTPDGYRIVLSSIFEPEKAHLVTTENYFRVNSVIQDIVAKEDCNKKHILIYDLKNLTATYAYTMLDTFRKYIPPTAVSWKFY